MASKRKRLDRTTLFILGGVLAVETVACVGVSMSIHNRKVAMEQTLSGKEAALANVRTVSASLPSMQEEYAKMQAQVRFLESGLPSSDYIPTLLGQVERTAKTCGVKISDFRPKAAASPAPPSGTPDGATQHMFDITVSGNYRQVQQFLHALTRFRKILALNSIKLQPTSDGGKGGVSPVLNGSLSFTAYVLPPVTPSAAPVPPQSTASASQDTVSRG